MKMIMGDEDLAVKRGARTPMELRRADFHAGMRAAMALATLIVFDQGNGTGIVVKDRQPGAKQGREVLLGGGA